MKMKTILVIGGTGRLAQPVVQALIRAGYMVRILTRSPKQSDNAVRWQPGTLEDQDSLRTAVQDIDAVYLNLPATLNPHARFIPEWHGLQNILEVLSPTVTLLKLSEIGATDDTEFTDLRYKYYAEQLIRNSGFPYLIFRPTWFMESLPLMLTRGRFIVYGGRQRSPIYWIAGQDYAKQVIKALQQAATFGNRIFTMQGLEALTFFEAAYRYARAVDKTLQPVSAPLWMLRVYGMFSRQMRFNYEVMRYYDHRHEVFEADETWSRLGKPTITIDQFAQGYKLHSGLQPENQQTAFTRK
jgi:uncharacterized protein YbjT (DUF2867 family)